MTPGEFILVQGDTYSHELTAFEPPEQVAAVYNPLIYARDPWSRYLNTYGGTRKRVVFLGMNPGPWGMAQTGIPFGEIDAVREWMGITGTVNTPEAEHPKRKVAGFACTRSEVSGRRLWGFFRDHFPKAETFFRHALVLNYCPLVFMGETGKNITPDKLPVEQRNFIYEICDRFLADAIAVLQPEVAIGIGSFARKRLDACTEEHLICAQKRAGAHGVDIHSDAGSTPPRIETILHPSPASPRANRGWAAEAMAMLESSGVWERIVDPT